MRIAFTTLGCKINQFETDAMRQEFLSKGGTIVPFDAEADVYIINTCSVTAKSDYRCRQMIRSAIRRSHGAKIVVTGCYAETRPEEIKNIPGVEHVFGNREKGVIPDRVMSLNFTSDDINPHNSNVPIEAVHTRTRGFLKIQDGCDNRCSYCIVPHARGSSRSAASSDVIREFTHFVEKGCHEVVLTGIHIGTYGSDRGDGINLTDIIKTLVSTRGGTRIRLSSIEPKEITNEIIGYLGHGLCRHLHVPLQSGDDTILSSMKRNYTSSFYRNLLEEIAKRVPGIALGADVMVGYPGEGDKEFHNSLRLVEQTPLTHLHVFSYSPRPGTPAADMKGQVPEPIKKERNETLRILGAKKNLLFRRKCLGSEFMVVVEDKVDPQTGLLTGLTDNYIRVHILGTKSEHIGEKINIRLHDVTERHNLGSFS